MHRLRRSSALLHILRIPSAGLLALRTGPSRTCGESLARHKLECQVSFPLAWAYQGASRHCGFVAGGVQAVGPRTTSRASGKLAAQPTAAYAGAHEERQGVRALEEGHEGLALRPAKILPELWELCFRARGPGVARRPVAGRVRGVRGV